MTGDQFESNDKTAPREGHPGSNGPDATPIGVPSGDSAGANGADDEFLLELGDLEDSAEVEPRAVVERADDDYGLEGLFDGPSNRGGDDSDASNEDDALFDAGGHLGGSGKGFRGAKPAPEFVEDHAGWLGDDVDMGAMVGESRPATPFSGLESTASEFDSEIDPFDVGEIEVENLDDSEREVANDEAEDEDGGFVLFDAQDDAELEQAIAPGLNFSGNDAAPTAEAAADDLEAEFEPAAGYRAFDLAPATEDSHNDDWAPLASNAFGGPLLSEDEEVGHPDSGPVTGATFGAGSRAFALDGLDDQSADDAPITPQWGGTEFTLDSVEDEADEFVPAASRFEPVEGLGQPRGFGGQLPDLEADGAFDEDGEPLEEHDPIYGDLASSGDPESLGYERWDDSEEVAAQRQAEFEEVAGIGDEEEFAAPPLRVVGKATRQGIFGRRLIAAAAVILVLGLSALGIFPEWFGMGGESTGVDRIQIARPKIDVSVPPPEVPEVPPEGQPETTDPATTTDPIGTNPPPVVENPPPDIELPVIPDVPDLTRPIGTVPPVVAVNVPPPVKATKPAAEPDFSPLSVGEFLEILGPSKTAVADAEGTISIGTKALALLVNDEIFVGVVRSMDAQYVTLDLQPGEVQIAMASLSRISSIDEAVSDESMEAEHGFVRLQNETRFFGRILRDPETGALIVQSDQSRIVLPRRQVAEFGASGAGNTQVLFEGDSAWLEERVRDQLKRFGSSQPAVRTPDSNAGDESANPPGAPGRSR